MDAEGKGSTALTSAETTIEIVPSTSQRDGQVEVLTVIDRSPKKTGRGWRFWLVFVALELCVILSALDLASVATALPVIIHDLNGTASFAWVSAGYTLASACVLPMSGHLADIFGRRPVLITFILLFALGSIICATARSINMLIASRVIQGIGSGGMQTLTMTVVGDLVTLRERGTFNAITGATFSVASVIGPSIGGAFAQQTTWRGLFYLNIPLSAIAITVIVIFLRLWQPKVNSYVESFLQLDWLGNTLIIGGGTSCIIGLTWAGFSHPWKSVEVLIPFVIGLVCLIVAFLYEFLLARHLSSIVSNRTSFSGYFGSFMHGLVIYSASFYLPVYFQAVKLAPPVLSGLYILPSALTLSPSAIIQGILVNKTGRYRLINAIGWCGILIGMGLFCLLRVDTPVAVSIPFQIIAAAGFGFLFVTTFSVLAPLEVENNAQALAFLTFARTFSQSWSIAIGATILQTRLRHCLPAAFLNQFHAGDDISYVAISLIRSLQQPLQDEVRLAFANSLLTLWHVLLAFCAAGLLSVLLQKDLPLHNDRNERWGLEERQGQPQAENPKENEDPGKENV
ncbi:MFS general substrate transporter [Laetiporus sulphureus 93-53]|uniref:MFS general substrate transporter n=1 Tax=Laetiporus sulphureus 93-53 TaxID=1314785 RepID=A0A165DW98_9APHY|nr:MFS general substrate transporter [Laetiporus sulphureus 93-53]KZT05759.1 MFS general substrate transporter [Laetiporus sulphureus 93-53]